MAWESRRPAEGHVPLSGGVRDAERADLLVQISADPGTSDFEMLDSEPEALDQVIDPLATGARDDVRLGVWLTTSKGKALVAYALCGGLRGSRLALGTDESSDEIAVNIFGVIHDGQGVGCHAQQRPGQSGGELKVRSCVANAWQESQRAPFATNGLQRVSAGQTHNADNGQQRPLSVPRFPWYY